MSHKLVLLKYVAIMYVLYFLCLHIVLRNITDSWCLFVFCYHPNTLELEH